MVKAEFNPINAELNTNCHLLALLEAHHVLHISRIKVNFNAIFFFLAKCIIKI
jgi:hypothetical protein